MKKLIIFITLLCISVPCYASGNDNNTLLLVPCDGSDASTTIPDTSVGGNGGAGHGNADVTDNAQLDTAVKKFGTAALLCDSSGDYIGWGDSTDWDFGTGDFTLDGWFMHTNLGKTGFMFDVGAGDTGSKIGIAWNLSNANDWVLRISDSAKFTITTSDPLQDVWYHLALVRESGTVYMYKDGVEISGGGVASTEDITGSTEGINIGARSNGQFAWEGSIDEIRVSNVARWSTNFTPPTEAYSEGAGGGSQVIFVN